MSRIIPFSPFRTTRQTRAQAVIDLDCSSQTTTSAVFTNVNFAGTTNFQFAWPGGKCLWMLTCRSYCNNIVSGEYQVIRNSDSSVLAGDVGGTGKWDFPHASVGVSRQHTFFDVQTPPKGVYDINLQWRTKTAFLVFGMFAHRILLVALPAE